MIRIITVDEHEENGLSEYVRDEKIQLTLIMGSIISEPAPLITLAGFCLNLRIKILILMIL